MFNFAEHGLLKATNKHAAWHTSLDAGNALAGLLVPLYPGLSRSVVNIRVSKVSQFGQFPLPGSLTVCRPASRGIEELDSAVFSRACGGQAARTSVKG